MTALTELRAKVANGTAKPFSIFNKYDTTWEPLYPNARDASNAYFGSLDAAKSLHEAVLPGWEWRLRDNRAWVWTGVLVYGGEEVETAEFCGLPARAWLLAILDALIAKEASDG